MSPCFNITELWPFFQGFSGIVSFKKKTKQQHNWALALSTSHLLALCPIFFFFNKTRPLFIYGPVTHQFVTTVFLNPCILPARPSSYRKKFIT